MTAALGNPSEYRGSLLGLISRRRAAQRAIAPSADDKDATAEADRMKASPRRAPISTNG